MTRHSFNQIGGSHWPPVRRDNLEQRIRSRGRRRGPEAGAVVSLDDSRRHRDYFVIDYGYPVRHGCIVHIREGGVGVC